MSAFVLSKIFPSMNIDASQRFIFGVEGSPEPLGSFKIDNIFVPTMGSPSLTNFEMRNEALSGYRWIHGTASDETYGSFKLQKFLEGSPTGIDIITFNDDGSFHIPGVSNAKYIIQTAEPTLPNAQVLGVLSTGILKNTTTTGVLSIAVAGTDYYSPGNPTTLIDDFTSNINPLLSYGNLGVGTDALNALTLGSPTNTLNVAIGPQSLLSLTTGGANTTTGFSALLNLISGNANSIFGAGSFPALTSGDNNCAFGSAIGNSMTTGNENCMFGHLIAPSATTLSDCSFFGSRSGTASSSITGSSAFGKSATSSANNSTVIGANSSVSGSNSTAIGANVSVSQANAVVLGNGCNVGIGTNTPAYRLDVVGTGGIAINANSNRIIGVSTPVDGTDAANMAYVDSKSVSIGDAKFIIQTADADLPNAQILGALSTGVLKNTTTTGVLSIAVAGTDYAAPGVADAKFIIQTADADVPNAQILGSLATGLLKNTTATGVLSTATAGIDYYAPSFPTIIKDSFGSSPHNLSIGRFALEDVTTAAANLAIGLDALRDLSTGNGNLAIGAQLCLSRLVNGASNVAIGNSAFDLLTSGNFNVGFGLNACFDFATGDNNVGIGTQTFEKITGGNKNVSLGSLAGAWISGGTATLTECLFLGYNTTPSVSGLTNATAIGAHAVVSSSNSIVLGRNDATKTNVGIGTSSPTQARLVVSGGVANVGSEDSVIRAISSSTATKIELQNTTASTGKIYELRSNGPGSFEIVDRTGAASRLFIGTTGLVGINTFSPTTAQLVVNGGVQNVASEDSCIRTISSSLSTKIELQNTTPSTGKLFELKSNSTGSFDIVDRTAAASRLFISTAGLIGIGTASPTTAKLVVSGGVTNVGSEESVIRAVSGSTATKIELQNTTASTGKIYEVRSTDGGVFEIVDRTAGASRLLIASDGKVGVGNNNPHAQLQLPSTVTNRQLVLYEAANNDYQFHGFGSVSGGFGYNINGTGDSHIFYAGASSSSRNEVARISGLGDITAADTIFGRRPSGTCYMQANATATSITAPNWVKIAGTTSSASLNKFTMPSNNRLQYTGTPTITAYIVASVTAFHDVAAGSVVGFSFFKNGVQVVPSSAGYISALNITTNSSIVTMVSLATNDYIEVYGQTLANSNLTVSFLTVSITTT